MTRRAWRELRAPGDGFFEEEKKIRKDPAARVTKLLKEVFSRSGR